MSAPITTAGLVLLATMVFLAGFSGLSKARFRRHLSGRMGGDALELESVLRSKLASGAWFALTSEGALAIALPHRASVAWTTTWTSRAAVLVAVTAVVTLATVSRAAGTPAMRERYPEARLERWTPRARFLGACGWIVYLYGYELLFRGLLLFPLAESLPLSLALAVSTSIYVLAHLDKPLPEILGTLPMGLIFGWLAIETRSVLPGTLLHVAIAVTNEMLGATGVNRNRLGASPSS